MSRDVPGLLTADDLDRLREGVERMLEGWRPNFGDRVFIRSTLDSLLAERRALIAARQRALASLEEAERARAEFEKEQSQ